MACLHGILRWRESDSASSPNKYHLPRQVPPAPLAFQSPIHASSDDPLERDDRTALPHKQHTTMAESTDAAAPAADVETGTTTPEQIAAALIGITLGRTFPVTLPECPHCKKKNVMTVLDTHCVAMTYFLCVILGILSCLVLWWIPLILDSVSFLFSWYDAHFN